LTEVPVAQVCQNEKEGDIAAKKKELELADEEDFGNDCVGKAGISPSFLLICLFSYMDFLSMSSLFCTPHCTKNPIYEFPEMNLHGLIQLGTI
jgi:hypothetical protein